MQDHATRRSRRGIATPILIAGGVVAAGLLGYVLYKHFKNKNNPPSYSQGYGESYGQPRYGQPYAQQGQYPVPPPVQKGGGGYGYAYAPAAPNSTDERSVGREDPELGRLHQARQAAHQRLTAAISGGDPGAASSARAELERAQAALNSKMASMY